MIPFRVVVLGGGIAGLAAAHRLVELAGQRGIALDLAIVEARPHLGGTIATERSDGYLIEAGPDSFLTEKPWGVSLCDRLGLTPTLIGPRSAYRRTFVVHAGRLLPLPDGFQLVAPARLWPVVWSRLFSWPGKARMALDLVLPRGPAQGDESLAAFVTRRFGREVLERVAQPMVAGIYTADPETLSLAATMPRFLEMERTSRSVIRALRRNRVPREGSGPRWSLFVAPSDGMGALVEALAARLPAGALRTGSRVVLLVRIGGARGGTDGPSGKQAHYRVGLENGTFLEAQAVIVATEAHRASRLVAGLDAELARYLGEIPYASSATVTLAYRREDVAHPLDGFGFVVPRTEGRPLLACTFSSVKFPGRAPDGHVLLRAFLGGTLQAGVLDRDDASLAALAEDQVRGLLGASAAPRLVRLHRHESAMPQYLIGHLDRIAAIEARSKPHPGLAFAGAAYGGVGVPDCIRSGEEAAERVVAECLGGAGDAPAGAAQRPEIQVR